jgi:hypothetical protein
VKFFVPGSRLVAFFLVPAFLLAEYSFAQTAGPLKIPTALICGPFSGNPPRTPAFADKFTLEFSNGAFSGVRPARRQKGSETYKGSIDPSGKIKISGVGHFEDRSSQWASEFAGQFQEKAPTILQGTVRLTGVSAGARKCSIGFLLPAADLKKAFSPGEPAAQPRPQ